MHINNNYLSTQDNLVLLSLEELQVDSISAPSLKNLEKQYTGT